MKVSHKYAGDEVDALMPAGTADHVVAAIKTIYAGLSSATLTITRPATDGAAASSLKVKFEDSNNPKTNISSYTLLADGLTRVHPAGYAALFNAAIDSTVTDLTVTSCWRPMLGSIAHRAGLGLDVNYVGKTRMNRQELRAGAATGKGNANDSDNVSDAEVTRFGEYEKAIVANKKAQAKLTAAGKALAEANTSKDADKIAKAQAAQKTAAQDARDAEDTEAEARKEWDAERDAAEPASVRSFRASLLRCSCVRQLFDPWFMDGNTQDAAEATPNMQRGAGTSNERLHAHHLHVTVAEPKIL